MNTLEFKISSALKDIIGRDLVTDDFIAVFELVKNAFDAHATQVEISFLEVESGNGRIVIKDNGKGMNYHDLVNRWLFVAYSAKKEGTEDENYDYRDRIQVDRAFAGAKGIGRFSCDRLGSQLFIETTKKEQNAKTEVLITDWEKFEKDVHTEFVQISVLHETKERNSYGLDHGTVLVIEGLRSEWDRPKYLKLKDSLAKLINPIPNKGHQELEITINVPEEEERDSKEEEYYNKVNGKVENFIFETLGLKTTRIEAKISEDGSEIQTTLTDGGMLIYEISEENQYSLLENIDVTLFYLNQSAKLTFARRMGVPSVRYGHIFLYRNGFRIYPYGEPGEDPLKVDLRKAQGYSRFLGTRELMGHIDILASSEELQTALKETSSRGDGLIKTPTYEELEEFFWNTLKKLEKYVVEVQQWGLSIEEDASLQFKERVSNLVAKISGSESVKNFRVADNFHEILEASQTNSAETIVSKLNQIAYEKGDEQLIKQAKYATTKLTRIQEARKEAERLAEEERLRAEVATKKLKDQISENLFLKSISTSDYQEVISLLHHIGIYAGTIDNNLKGISLRVQNDIPLSKDDLNDIIRLISFETKKILNVVAFATKANFKLKTEAIEVDLNQYIKEYLLNIIPTVTDKSLQVEVKQETKRTFVRKVKPIEVNIVIDNIVNNAKKARADELLVLLDENEKGRLTVAFADNGVGIKEENLDKIYGFGFTTTDGSGVGLYHVREIIDSMKGTVTATNNTPDPGVTLKIEFK